MHRWSGVGFVLARAQEPEQAAHLGERLPSGLLDREKGLAGTLRIRLEEESSRSRLDRHDADAVRDHVMEVGGDVGALGGDRGMRSLLALALDPRGLPLEPNRALCSPPERKGRRREPACKKKKADDAELGVSIRDDELQPGAPADGHDARKADRGAGDCLLFLVVCTHEPEGERERDERERRQDLAVGGGLGIGERHAGEPGEDEDRSREGEATAQEQWQRPEECRGHDGEGRAVNPDHRLPKGGEEYYYRIYGVALEQQPKPHCSNVTPVAAARINRYDDAASDLSLRSRTKDHPLGRARFAASADDFLAAAL